jgi:hypothetical protein
MLRLNHIKIVGPVVDLFSVQQQAAVAFENQSR